MKGLADYLEDDPSLAEKMTYEEFENSVKVANVAEPTIDEAYKNYLDFIGGE